MNIVVLGDTKQANDEIIATIQKKLGVSTETVDSCSEKVTNRIGYSLRTVEIKLNDISYNVTNACEKDSTIKYLMVSEGDQTVDGAILIVKASSGVTQEVKDYLHTLNKIGIEKVVVYIVEDADSSKVEEELKETLEDNRFDRDNTPIVKGSTTEEEKMEELITKANNWIEKITFYQEPSVVLSYDKMKLYTYFLQDLDSAEDLTFTINKVKYQPKVTLEKGHEKMTTGEIQEITIKLEEGIPAERGMRVMIKRGDTLIGIGVISELK